MKLSAELLTQFAKVTNDNKKEKKSSTVYGTAKEFNGVIYVQMDGSELLTPASATTDMKDGDRVTITIKDHTAIATGNMSSPAARKDDVNAIDSKVDIVNSNISTINSNITTIDSKIRTQDSTISTIDSNVKTNSSDISTLKSTVETQGSTISTIDSKVNTHDSDISTLKSTVNTQESSITTINSTLETHDSSISNIGTKVDNQGSSITNIQSSIDTQNSNISAINSSIDVVNSAFKIENNEITGLSKVVTDSLVADKAFVGDLVATNIVTEKLNAVNADIQSLDSDIADINTLIFGSATGTVIQTEFANAVIAQLGNAQIKSAMIESISAGKITSGDIITNNVRVLSEDGSLVISDETIQIKDNTRVRVQIGKDSSNDYSINIWDAEGNLMFSKGGITDKAIKSSIIRNDMVSDDANISATKLDIDSLFTSINSNGTKTIKSTKIYLDDENQALDVAFKSMTTNVTNLGNTVSSQGTSISAIQGQISSKIWQQDIDDSMSGLNTRMTTAESNIQQNKDKITLEVSNLSSSINTTNGNVTAISNRTTTLEQSTSGISTKVTSLESTASGLSSKVSTLEQTASGISLRIDDLKTNLEGQIEEASKKATNYLSFNNEGLVVGNMSAETLGNNVLIDSNGIDIRDGTTVLASFEDDSISLGRYSENSSISLCGGKGRISLGEYGTSDEYLNIASTGDLRLYSNEECQIYGCVNDGGAIGRSAITLGRSTSGTGDPLTHYVTISSKTVDAYSYLNVGIGSSIFHSYGSLLLKSATDSIEITASNGGGLFHVYSDNFNVTNLGLDIDGVLNVSGAINVGGFSNASDFRTKLSVWNYDNTTNTNANYPGLAGPDGTTTGYVRTPQNGLLPFRSGGSSNVGTSSWPFTNGYFNNLYINGIKYEGNKILWSGAYYMTSTQSCTLSESISSQSNGVVLVWSDYSNNETSNSNFNCFFVPKSQVSSHDGKGVTMFLASAQGTHIATKYVYISNTGMTGYAFNNKESYTASGITFNPRNYVLRYVIGV